MNMLENLCIIITALGMAGYIVYGPSGSYDHIQNQCDDSYEYRKHYVNFFGERSA